MTKNKNLRKAKKEKNDEFYTQLSDIENELMHYKEHFRGKTVFCNCDDPYESNFFKYFALNFEFLGLKKLIATCYAGSSVANNKLLLYGERKPYKVEIDHIEDLNGDGAFDLQDIDLLLREPGIVEELQGDGDFRSPECVELLKESDIVVSNPPFSLFREYIAQLIEYDKKFLIIGNKNAVTYKEFFPLLKDNKVWIGYNNVKEFIKPNGETQKFGNIGWFTNRDIQKRYYKLDLFKRYSKNPEEFPKYDNYDAIEVSKVSNIPCDYAGIMGVPITFLDKYCPEQFEIVGNEYLLNIPKGRAYVNDKKLYSRIFIKAKEENK